MVSQPFFTHGAVTVLPQADDPMSSGHAEEHLVVDGHGFKGLRTTMKQLESSLKAG